jgi:7,8-dihydropterin-6-yl-methyl-4-(beta-D-ribofuranosyl)aminobenzene 5'-phosphate synthase
MKISIIYDNEAFREDLKGDWGFSCLVEVYDRRILFDTGAKSSILFENMKKLNIEPKAMDEIFISHDHWDHTGGLTDFLKINPVKVYLPLSCQKTYGASEAVKIKESIEIHENIFSTGELENIEQSLVVKTQKGLVVIVGCSHPGVKNILKAASQWGEVYALIGGLHGFKDFDLLKDLELVCATHCTKFKSEIKSLYPKKYIRGGAGKIIEI